MPHPGIMAVLWSTTVTSWRRQNCVTFSNSRLNIILLLNPITPTASHPRALRLVPMPSGAAKPGLLCIVFVQSLNFKNVMNVETRLAIWSTKTKNAWRGSEPATSLVKNRRKQGLERPTKAQSDRFSGCGIKPRGSGAGEIVPAGRDQSRRDKAHSNSLVDTH